jgi:hypothetical protein
MIQKSHGAARMRTLKIMMNGWAGNVRPVIHDPAIDGETGGCNRSVQVHYQRMNVRRCIDLSVAKMHVV